MQPNAQLSSSETPIVAVIPDATNIIPLPIVEAKTHRIHWYDSTRGTHGVSKNHYTEVDAIKLCGELNRDYAMIDHEVRPI